MQRGQSLLVLSLRRVQSKLLQHPWIKHVSLERRLPHTLVIRAQEREETAWTPDPSGDGCLTLGEGGVVVSTDCARADSLIELRGVRLSGDGLGGVVVDGSIARLIDALRGGELASLGTQRIDVTDPEFVELETGSGLRILLGDASTAVSRLDALASLRRSLDLEDYEVVDLRFGGEATLVPR